MSKTSDMQEAARRIAAREANDDPGTGDDDGSEGDGAEGVAPPKKAAATIPRGGITPNQHPPGSRESQMDRSGRFKDTYGDPKKNPANIASCETAHGANSARTTSPKITRK